MTTVICTALVCQPEMRNMKKTNQKSKYMFCNQSINQSIDWSSNMSIIEHSINQSINWSRNKSIIEQSINQSTVQSMDQSKNQSINQSTWTSHYWLVLTQLGGRKILCCSIQNLGLKENRMKYTIKTICFLRREADGNGTNRREKRRAHPSIRSCREDWLWSCQRGRPARSPANPHQA